MGYNFSEYWIELLLDSFNVKRFSVIKSEIKLSAFLSIQSYEE